MNNQPKQPNGDHTNCADVRIYLLNKLKDWFGSLLLVVFIVGAVTLWVAMRRENDYMESEVTIENYAQVREWVTAVPRLQEVVDAFMEDGQLSNREFGALAGEVKNHYYQIERSKTKSQQR